MEHANTNPVEGNLSVAEEPLERLIARAIAGSSMNGRKPCARICVRPPRILAINEPLSLRYRHTYVDQYGRPVLVRRAITAAPHKIGSTIISVEEQLTGRQAHLRRAKSGAHLAYAYQIFTDNVRTLVDLHIVTFNEAAIARYNTHSSDETKRPELARLPAHSWFDLRELGRLDLKEWL